jgi:hypothetical protein
MRSYVRYAYVLGFRFKCEGEGQRKIACCRSRMRAQSIERSRRFADGSRPQLLREVQLAPQGFGRICPLSELLQVISLILKAGSGESQRLPLIL